MFHLAHLETPVNSSLKVETAKKVQLKERSEPEKCKLAAIQDNPEYNDGI